LGLENVADIPQRLRGEHVVFKSQREKAIEKAEKRVIFSLNNKRLPVRG